MEAAVRTSFMMALGAASCLGSYGFAAAQDHARCAVDPAWIPRLPVKLGGSVIGMLSPERVRVVTRWVEQQTGVGISPDYADLPRILVKVVTSDRTFETVAAVVDGHMPQIGDHVDVLSRYLDPRSRCEFIPWTVRGLDAVS